MLWEDIILHIHSKKGKGLSTVINLFHYNDENLLSKKKEIKDLKDVRFILKT